MKFKPGEVVVLKHNLKLDYANPDGTFFYGVPLTTRHIRGHCGHKFKIIGTFDHEYIAQCECGKQYEEGAKQSGFWFLVDEMVEEVPSDEQKVGRFDSILGG